MKTALEIITEILSPHDTMGVLTNDDIVKCMKLYAEQAIDAVAEQSQQMIYEINGDSPLHSFGLTLRNFQVCYASPKQSILKIKEELK